MSRPELKVPLCDVSITQWGSHDSVSLKGKQESVTTGSGNDVNKQQSVVSATYINKKYSSASSKSQQRTNPQTSIPHMSEKSPEKRTMATGRTASRGSYQGPTRGTAKVHRGAPRVLSSLPTCKRSSEQRLHAPYRGHYNQRVTRGHPLNQRYVNSPVMCSSAVQNRNCQDVMGRMFDTKDKPGQSIHRPVPRQMLDRSGPRKYLLDRPKRGKYFGKTTDSGTSKMKRKHVDNEKMCQVMVKFAELMNSDYAIDILLEFLAHNGCERGSIDVGEAHKDTVEYAIVSAPSINKGKQYVKKLVIEDEVEYACLTKDTLKPTPIDRDKVIEDLQLELKEKSQKPLVDKDREKDNIKSEIDKIGPKQNKTKTGKAKFVPLDVYEKRTDILQTFQSKLEDLESQTDQFRTQLKKLGTKLEESRSVKTDDEFMSTNKCVKVQYEIELERLSVGLPMYSKRTQIVELVENNQVCIILGETGSGKSTNIIQYLHEAGIGKDKKIVCTQPRKIAAISLAKRVSEELKVELGKLVGYTTGMMSKCNQLTKLVYANDHILLNECIRDRLLSEYSCIIIDEAHERSVHTDLLLGMIKHCLIDRPELRLIITSATIDPEPFVKYFSGCPVLQVSGRLFPVEVVYSPESSSDKDYMRDSVQKVEEICSAEPPGDVLVFLTTPAETEKASGLLKQLLKPPVNVSIYQLHGKLQPEEQQKVFAPPAPNTRKVVFATNSAETSITIPGIKYVVDCGYVKELNYNPVTDFSALKVCRVSQSSANQRKGRAGRIESGKCFRMYKEDDYLAMCPISHPEILRVNVAQALLKLMALGVENPAEFDFVQPPAKAALESAVTTLDEIGATLDGELTDLGKKLSKLTVPPRLGKAVLLSIEENIGFEMVIAVTMSTLSQSVFFRVGTIQQKEKADCLKARFCHKNGDILTYVDLYKEWFKIPERAKSKWCVENAVNAKSMRIARDTIKDFTTSLKQDLGISLKQQFIPQNDLAKVEKQMCKILCCCFSANLCYYSGHPKFGYFICCSLDRTLAIHPSSSLYLHGVLPKWVIYLQVLTTSQDFMLNVTRVEIEWIRELISSSLLKPTFDESYIENMELKKFKVEYIGKTLMQRMIGPRHSHLKTTETDIGCKLDTRIAIDVSGSAGRFDVFCPSFCHDRASDMLSNIIAKEREQLRSYYITKPILSQSASKLLLGAGGQVLGLSLPGDYYRVIIRGVAEDLLSDVKRILSEFGEIQRLESYIPQEDCSLVKLANVVVTYKSHKDALNLVTHSKDRLFGLSAEPNDLSQGRGDFYSHKLRFLWARRENNGYGKIEFYEDAMPDVWMAFQSFTYIGQNPYRPAISVQWHHDDVGNAMLRFVPSLADEETVTQSLNEHFQVMGLPERCFSQFKVMLHKKKVNPETPNELERIESGLRTFIERCIEHTDYFFKFHIPREKSYHFSGFIKLRSESDWQKLQRNCNAFPLAKDHRIELHCVMEASLYVQPAIYAFLKNKIASEITRVQRNANDAKDKIVIDTGKSTRTGSTILKFESTSHEKLNQVKNEFELIVNGNAVTYTDNQFKILNSNKGKQFLAENVPKHVKVVPDYRSRSVHFYLASENVVSDAKEKIGAFLKSVINREIHLVSEDKTPGVLKALLLRFGPSLEPLCNKTSVFSLHLSVRNHLLTVCGSTDSVQLVVDEVATICRDISGVSINPETTLQVDCPVCLCPVEKEGAYIMELCGHVYCKECVHGLVQSAINDTQFPIKCVQETCTEVFCIDDLQHIVETCFQSLLTASLDSFVSDKRNDYHYCNTPDCPSIYRVTADGTQFICSICDQTCCTRCHKSPGHMDELTCLQTSIKSDKELNDWLAADKKNRTLCPTCVAPIEKDGGCMHMTCTKCNSHICWRCKKVFKSSSTVYNHLPLCTVDGSDGGIF